MNPITNIYKPSFSNNVTSTSINDISTRSLFTVAIGEESGKSATGSNNVFIGYRTGFNTIETHNSVFIGSHTGFNTVQGDGNVFIGSKCASNSTTCSFNTIAGYNSAINMIHGNYNTIFGYDTVSYSDTINFNTIFGTSCGKNMDQSIYNIIIGTNTTNNMQFGSSNIYIGTQNEPIKPNSDNSIILGNHNTIDDNSITIGNINSSSTKNCISIGTKIISQSVSTITDPLTQYDPLIINTAKQRLNIHNIHVSPQINNLIYTPLNIISPPIKLSTINNVDTTTTIYTIPKTTISTNSTNIKNIVRTDKIVIGSDLLYHINYPIVSTSRLYGVEIDLTTLPIDTVHKDVKLVIIEKPKYGYVDKILYNLDETIYITQYPEYRLLKNDRIRVSTVQYGFLSPEVFNIFIEREVDDISIPTQFYNSYIHPRYFYNNNEVILFEDGTSTTDIYYPIQNEIIVNNDIVLYYNVLDTYIHSSLDITYVISILPTSTIITPNIDNDVMIYVETPPKHGVLSSNSYISINKFEYFIKNPKITSDDNMIIRFIKNGKISIKSYNVILKNYLIHLDDIYINTNDIQYPLTQSLISNGYFWNNMELKHNNRPSIYVEDKNNFFNIQEAIKLDVNSITIDCLPFNSIDINEYVSKHVNVDRYNIYVISSPVNGYINNYNYIYYNTRNVSDQFRIVITVNNFIGFEYDIIDIQINIRNDFNITISTQYITENTITNVNTIHVDNLNNSIIKVYDKNYDYICQLDELVIYEEDIYNYYLVFGEIIDNVPINIYPYIIHNIRSDYYFEAVIPNNVSTLNIIDYQFKSILSDDFEIEFIINIKPYLNIEYNKFRFTLYIGNSIIVFTESFIIVDLKQYDYIFEYDNPYLIIITYSGLSINNKTIFNNIIFKDVNRIALEYNLNDNIINTELLINYVVPIVITNLTIATSLDTDGQNVLIGKDIVSSGIDNICIGKDFNTFGNNSIIIGNDIGSSQDLLFDNGIHDSIVIGNNNFQKSLAKNIIAIGNEIYKDFLISNQEEYQKASKYFSSNPIIIGNNLEYDDRHVINIGNKIVVKEDNEVTIGDINIKKELQDIKDEMNKLRIKITCQ